MIDDEDYSEESLIYDNNDGEYDDTMPDNYQPPVLPETNKKSAISADLIRGHINTIILRTLSERDKYGYEIISEIERKSHGQYELKQPTLYSALKRLETQGYIQAYWKSDEVSSGGRRKYFKLTDSGKEITEKNRAEWEYSRTVIDSLISDKSFDFSQPAPTPLDFRILKNSTSRVPTVKLHEVDSDAVENAVTEVKIEQNDTANSVQVENVEPTTVITQNTEIQTETVQPQAETIQPQQQFAEPLYDQQPNNINGVYVRRENSVNVIHGAENGNNSTQNYTSRLNTEQVYINKPEPERDYKNLINNIYSRTIRQQSATKPYGQPTQYTNYANYQQGFTQPQHARTEYLKAENDGLRIFSADRQAQSTGKYSQSYHAGYALLKSSAISSVYLMLLFAFSLIFRNDFALELGYSLTILAIACVNILIFAIMAFGGIGKNSIKPITHGYISVSIVVTIIAIFIVCVSALLLNVNFNLIGDVVAKIVLPSLILVAIPIFAVSFYGFSK